MARNGRYYNNSSRRTGVNFSRSMAASAAMKYYTVGTSAQKVESQRDDVSLKYYGRIKKIENRIVARITVKNIICALIVCACCITIIFAKSLSYNYQLENKRLLNLLEAEKEATASIIANSIEKIDVAYVEQVATGRLNMAKPQSYQIQYIEVPKTDYIVSHEAVTVSQKEKADIKSYKSIVNTLKKTKELIFANEGDESAGEQNDGQKTQD